jgi:predicted Rossmann fold flavoprotein
MYTAAAALTTRDLMDFFESEIGVPLKIERGNRVFPQSDKASDIVMGLVKKMRSLGVRIIHDNVTDILTENGVVTGLKCGARIHSFDRVVLATGGASYPVTGSDGSGYRMAKRLGIEVTPINPSLVPLVSKEKDVPKMQGLALKNISIEVVDNTSGKMIYSDFGELLFTHFGLSGPVILSASAHMRPMERDRFTVKIDLKPALDEATLDARLLSDFEKYKNKNLGNSLSDLLPSKMIPVFISRLGISEERKINSITKEERRRILELLKSFEITISGKRPIEEAIVTSGGIDISEISPKTMESKKIKGLYFAGEVMDLDAYTGGFNLRIAFCSANLAAISAIEE